MQTRNMPNLNPTEGRVLILTLSKFLLSRSGRFDVLTLTVLIGVVIFAVYGND